MATNHIQPGDVLTLTAPYTVTSGQGAQVGSIFGVALKDTTISTTGEFAVCDVFSLAKTSAQAWTVGQKIYWDDTNRRCDTDGTVGMLIGVATAVAANPSAVGNVRLNESAPSSTEGPQAAEANLAGTLTGTTDGTMENVADIALSTGNTYTDAAVNSAVNAAILSTNLQLKELQTKTNALLAKLRLAGIILP